MFITHGVHMNVLLSLDPEEIEALQAFHAEFIGHCSDAECGRHMQRIEQLERCRQSSHAYHDFSEAA